MSSGEVLGSWPDGTAKIELTFAAAPSSSITQYQVFFSSSSTYASFDLSAPVASISYGDATYDASPTDTKLLISMPAAGLSDGYFHVRYDFSNGQFTDPNQAVSSIVHVLKGTPGYALIPKKFSNLSYDYYMMRYEASLSSAGSNAGGDSVSSTEANVTGCSYKFHIDGTAADASCGTKVITKSAESVAGIAPQASITWPTAFYACRNASSGSAKVRLPTAEEWRRASQWIGSSYGQMWTTYSSNASGNCNVAAGSAALAGSAPLCKSALGVQDVAGNLREWVDKRMLQYSISAASESRFSYGPTIGRSLRNGIDNVVQRFHTIDPGVNGLALTLGADFKTPTLPDQKQYGPDVQTWTSPTTSDTGIGFRCLGFRSDTMPTMSQLALPDEPKFVTADLATAGRIPENLHVKDNRWETVAITINGTTTDAVAEGKVDVSWQPWSTTTCDSSGTCSSSDTGLIYKLYRFTEPNRLSIRTATPWALVNTGSNYSSDKPLDPLATDSSGGRLFTTSTTDGTLMATISNCTTATVGNCSFSDLSTTNGGTLSVGKIYNYILVVEDAAGNALTPSVQRYRSPFFAGPLLSGASGFRMEPRFRRASVFLVDEAHQQAQTRPQIMVHVPMDKSGLDHDFFIQKYEASLFSGSIANNNPAGSGAWPLQTNAGTWVKNAAVCHDVFLQTGTFDLTGCGNGSALNSSTATVQSKQGANTLQFVDYGPTWKTCRSTTFSDADGRNYSLHLPTNPEWLKAADWGDTDQDGTIEAAVNPFTSGVLSINALEGGSGGDSTTIRCHVDYDPYNAFVTNSSGAGSTSTCRSRYGAADMQGNINEYTNGQLYNGVGLDNGIDGLWLGQTFLAGWATPIVNLGSGNVDLLRGIPRTTGAAPLVFHDNDEIYVSTTGLQASLRGSHWYWGYNGAGRWTVVAVGGTGSGGGDYEGFRCAF